MFTGRGGATPQERGRYTELDPKSTSPPPPPMDRPLQGLSDYARVVGVAWPGPVLQWAYSRPVAVPSIIPGIIHRLNECQTEIAALCRRYGVQKLELFGSAAHGDFDPRRSNVDLFYEFDSNPSSLSDGFFRLLEGLEQLLGRKVDLVSSRDVRNPYCLRVANRHRITLYAA